MSWKRSSWYAGWMTLCAACVRAHTCCQLDDADRMPKHRIATHAELACHTARGQACWHRIAWRAGQGRVSAAAEHPALQRCLPY